MQTSTSPVTDVPAIPAMTTDAEREFYYRLALEAAGKGEIVELGAWLGASTAYLAAAIRDSGFAAKVRVYDKFQSKPGHVAKVNAFYQRHGGEIPVGPSYEQFVSYLGPLIDYVDPHAGQIEAMTWPHGPIAVLITDAPKRVPAISPVLTTLRDALLPGAIMAWQDFCHFPSYEIAACLYRLRDHIEFVEAVVPGTTLAFRVTSQWTADEVSLSALSLLRWLPEDIQGAWDYWSDFVAAEKRALFRCGAAMFLCDLGEHQEACAVLADVIEAPDVAAKWRYLNETRADFRTRYAPLFRVAKAAGALG